MRIKALCVSFLLSAINFRWNLAVLQFYEFQVLNFKLNFNTNLQHWLGESPFIMMSTEIKVSYIVLYSICLLILMFYFFLQYLISLLLQLKASFFLVVGATLINVFILNEVQQTINCWKFILSIYTQVWSAKQPNLKSILLNPGCIFGPLFKICILPICRD